MQDTGVDNEEQKIVGNDKVIMFRQPSIAILISIHSHKSSRAFKRLRNLSILIVHPAIAHHVLCCKRKAYR
jgi:hypothetical protein